MNLLTEPWIPVLRGDRPDIIRPDQIAEKEDPVTALAWPRPDFNLACLELLIGLLYLAASPETQRAWRRGFVPPDPADLRARLASYAPAFVLDGEGPRFLQDRTVAGEAPTGLDLLFIDAAGDSTAKKNADLMVHRSRYSKLAPGAAAMALFNLQSQAPSGGAGNRTSLRGGGPMVTLVRPAEETTLWELIWANVPQGRPLDAGALDALPWMGSARGSKDGWLKQPPDEPFTPIETFFSMPRRLWLTFGEGGPCSLTGAVSDRLATGVAQKPWGENYGSWAHPLTPYYRVKEGAVPLPVHPRAGRFGYRNWEGIVVQGAGSLRERAATVARFVNDTDLLYERFNVIVAGWAMDNMRPLDFVWSEQPVFLSADPARRDALEGFAVRMMRGAEHVAFLLAKTVKNGLGLEDMTKGALPALRDAFFTKTEPGFHEELRAFALGARDDAQHWMEIMRTVAMRLAEAHLLPGLADRRLEDAGRIVRELRDLRSELSGHRKQGRKLRALLDLPDAGEKETAA